MLRRFSVASLHTGTVQLNAEQSRHARDVLRLQVGEEAELLDNEGNHARGCITELRPDVSLEVKRVEAATARSTRLVVAAAIPKGSRADWMVEKLSELDVVALLPLASDRAVVKPESGKLERFARIAAESAKQSRRRDVMQVLPMQTTQSLCDSALEYKHRWCLSTTAPVVPIAQVAAEVSGNLLVAIGPEGGWTDRELDEFCRARFQTVELTQTILRIETAAVATAAIVMSMSKEKRR